MKDMYEPGNNDVKPNAVSFTTVINAMIGQKVAIVVPL